MRRLGRAVCLALLVAQSQAAGVLPAQSAMAATVVAAAPSARAADACGTPGTPTTTVYLPNITKALGGPSGWVTPFIVQNVGTQSAALEVSFYRFSDGALVTCRKVGGLRPGRSFADMPNDDADLPADTQFSVVVRSFGAQVVSVVNEIQGAGEAFEGLSYTGSSSGATKVYLPNVTRRFFGYDVPFIIQNLGSAQAHISVDFVSFDATLRFGTAIVANPRQSAVVDPDFLPAWSGQSNSGLRDGLQYAVTITSDQPVAVVVNAHNETGAPVAYSHNGLSAPGAAKLYAPYAAKNAEGIGRTSNLVVQNVGPTAVAPTLTFTPLGGGTPQTFTMASIPAGAARAFEPLYTSGNSTLARCGAASTSCLGDGVFSLVIDAPGGQIAAVVLPFSASTVMAYAAAPAAGNRAYLPNITRTLGGPSGWTTPFVLQSAGAVSATARWYRFSDGALVARQAIGPLSPGVSLRVDPRSVPGLADDAQYAVVVDAVGGSVVAIVTELSALGGDGAMAYEGFAATVDTVPAPTIIDLAPGSVSLSTGIGAQLTATVKDQFDNPLPGVGVLWTVTPPTLGSVSMTGLFTAGDVAGTGTIDAHAGAAAASVPLAVLPPLPVTLGGISFLQRTTQSAEVYTETTISTAEAVTVATRVDFDIAQIQQDYAHQFAVRPPVYVLGTNATYRTAQAAILGIAAAGITSDESRPFDSAGVFYHDKVALDWSQLRLTQPIVAARHELTHMMIQQIAGPLTDLPAWLNEGSARLEEFTVPDSSWLGVLNRYRAFSMAATAQLLSLDALTSQDIWNSRLGLQSQYQYAEASQAVKLLRDDIGLAGQIRILELMATDAPYDAAYQTVSGRTAASFAATVPARMLGLGVAPGIAFAKDTGVGAGSNGPTYVVYGYPPNASLGVNITGAATGSTNAVKSSSVDSYGVVFGFLTSTWPPDTYVFTITSPGFPTVTASFTKAP